jgi:Recombination endonuclease VII
MSTEAHKAASRRWAAENRDKVNAMWRAWYAANKARVSARNRLARIERPEVFRRGKRQPEPTRPKPSICECCGKAPRKNGMHLDHCHLTGEFRGWLCGPCNQGIGLLGDAEGGLQLAIKYLKRSRQ